MIDLTNKSVDEINGLINTYSSVLNLYENNQKHIPNLAYIIGVSVYHINDKHNENTSYWKAFCLVGIEKLYFDDKLNTEKNIIEYVDNFFHYKKNEYDSYCENIISCSDYERDYGFVMNYVNN